MATELFYTYIYNDPTRQYLGLDGEPFYVGKGVKSRVWAMKNDETEKRIRTLRKIGSKSKIDIINTTNEFAALWLERVLIKAFGRKDLGEGPLLNLTSGGQGGSTGMKQSPETIAKRVAKTKGMKRTQVALENLKSAHTQERRFKSSERMKNRVVSDETRKKSSTAMKDYVEIHPEHIERLVTGAAKKAKGSSWNIDSNTGKRVWAYRSNS